MTILNRREISLRGGEIKHSKFKLISCGLTLCLLLFFSPYGEADEAWTGHRVMDEVLKRHVLFPYVFEEQTMILMDDAGNRDVRKLRRYSRIEADETVKFLLVFDDPADVRGVALLVNHPGAGSGENAVYLPAFGNELKFSTGKNRGSYFLGTDFAIEDLATETLSDFRYTRTENQKIDKVDYLVVEALPRNKEVEKNTGYSLRRHFIRQDNYFIVRTDYFDRRGRFFKRQTFHDLKNVTGDKWRANMVLMENIKKQHKTLIKINRRVFSHDYVPSEMFTFEWILENRHIITAQKSVLTEASRSPEDKDEKSQDSLEKEERQSQNAGHP